VIFHPNGCVSFSGVNTTDWINIFSVQDSLDVRVEVADNVSVGSAVYVYTDRETLDAVRIVRNYGPTFIITAFLTFVITIFGNVVFYFIVLARRGNC